MTRKRERLALSRPKKGASGKTGAWRTFRPVWHADRCIHLFDGRVTGDRALELVERLRPYLR